MRKGGQGVQLWRTVFFIKSSPLFPSLLLSAGFLALPASSPGETASSLLSAPKVAYYNASNQNISAKVARGRQILNIAARGETVIHQRISPSRKAPSSKYSAFPLSAKDRRSPRSDSSEVAIRR